MAMHERISFNHLCFLDQPLEDDPATWRELGARRIGVMVDKLEAAGWERGREIVREVGLPIATMTHPFMQQHTLDQPQHWGEARDRLGRSIALARDLGIETIYMVTGGRGSLDWEEAAEAFREALKPCAEVAAAHGIPLLIEPANTGYADIHITHTLRDTVTLARRCGIAVCIDIFACWTEPDLAGTIADALPLTHLVQVGDYAAGDQFRFSRAVPGDGIIPLERILGQMLDLGYRGSFDLEILGRRISHEGTVAATRRAGQWLDRFLRSREAGAAGDANPQDRKDGR